MHPFDPTDKGLATLAVRAGQTRGAEDEHAEPIYTTSSFVARDAAQAAARFAETEPGNIYSRFTNPTVRCFEERLAALEGGVVPPITLNPAGPLGDLPALPAIETGDLVALLEQVPHEARADIAGATDDADFHARNPPLRWCGRTPQGL